MFKNLLPQKQHFTALNRGISPFRRVFLPNIIAVQTLHAGRPVFTEKVVTQEKPVRIFSEPVASFIEDYKLTHPTRWVPLFAGYLVILSTMGIYEWNADSLMLGTFMIFVGLIYTRAGPAIKETFDADLAGRVKDFTDIEDRHIAILNQSIEKQKLYETYDVETEEFIAAKRNLREKMTQAAPNMFQQRKSEYILGKLNKVLKAEQEFRDNSTRDMILKATGETIKKYGRDSALQKSTLDQALKAIESNSKAGITGPGDELRKFIKQLGSDKTYTEDLKQKSKEKIDRIVEAKTFEQINEFEILKNAK